MTGFSLILVGVLTVGAGTAAAQSMSVSDRVAWAEARLAFEEGHPEEALMLIDEVLGLAGHSPAILYDAAAIALDAGQYLKAEHYITAALAADDPEFKASKQYEPALMLAARIQRTLRPMREDLLRATPLPFTDNLIRIGFAVERKDRDSACEWKFERGGLMGKHRANASCFNGEALSAGPVRIDVTVEKRGGAAAATAGIVFGRRDEKNYFMFRIHPELRDAGGPVSVISVRDGKETPLRMTAAPVAQTRTPATVPSKGPWSLSVEIHGRRIDWFVDGRHLGTGYADSDVYGNVMVQSSGKDGGEFLFRNLAIDRLTSFPQASR
jgi:hypothetical protein